MRRTNQEFRDEILRREKAYRARQKQRRKTVLTVALCFVLVIFGGAMSLPLMSGMGAGSAAPEAAAPMEGLMQSAAEAPAAAEPNYAMGQSDGAEEYAAEQIPMVMIDGKLYLDTGYCSRAEKSGMPDGEITSRVDSTEIPEKNDQSNFGIGYGYQFGSEEGTVEIYVHGSWRIFATEEAMTHFSE